MQTLFASVTAAARQQKLNEKASLKEEADKSKSAIRDVFQRQAAERRKSSPSRHLHVLTMFYLKKVATTKKNEKKKWA